MRPIAVLLAACALAWVGVQEAARAETADEIATLARKGLGEEVLLAAVERSAAGFNMTAEQIVKLKEAGVSDKVIAAMLRKTAAPPAPAAAAGVPDAPAASSAPAAAQAGVVNIENVDDRGWSCLLDRGARTLWIAPPETRDHQPLPAHGGISMSVPAGTYEARYAGEGTGSSFTVTPGDRTLLLVSRVETADFEGLYVSVFEKGERRGGARLAVLKQGSAGTQPATAYQYTPPATTAVLEPPSRTVIYTSPVYVDPWPCYYYHGPTWYPYRPAYIHPRFHTGVSIRFGRR